MNTSVVAMDYQGLVMTLAAAESFSTDFEAMFFNFYCGLMAIFGEGRSTIQQCDKGDSDYLPIWGEIHVGRKSVTAPSNAFPELRMIPELRVRRTYIELTDHVRIQGPSGNRLHYVRGPTFADNHLYTTLVTGSCSHGYHGIKFQTTTADSRIRTRQDLDRSEDLEKEQQGESFTKSFLKCHSEILLAAVERNPDGQWVSIYGNNILPGRYLWCVLQRDMCTGCILALITNMAPITNMKDRYEKYYIIPARLEGEDMD